MTAMIPDSHHRHHNDDTNINNNPHFNLSPAPAAAFEHDAASYSPAASHAGPVWADVCYVKHEPTSLPALDDATTILDAIAPEDFDLAMDCFDAHPYVGDDHDLLEGLL